MKIISEDADTSPYVGILKRIYGDTNIICAFGNGNILIN